MEKEIIKSDIGNNQNLTISYNSNLNNCGVIDSKNSPTARSLHTLVYLNKSLYLFGGYDGNRRTNDFYKYDLLLKSWSKIVTQDIPPSPRERHVAVVHDNSLFIFGGYDGINRLNDFYEFIYSGSGLPPTPRHSMCAVVFDGNMFVFSGYDGFCRSELHRFNFETNTWSEIKSRGSWPRERYRTSAAIYKNSMYIYGGHDGTKQLDDFWCFDLKKFLWEEIKVQNLPQMRDSHTTFVYKDSLYIQGGSVNVQSKADFFEYNFNSSTWTYFKNTFDEKNSVFCHSGAFVPFQDTFYIFGGFNGQTRHNIFRYFCLKEEKIKTNSNIYDSYVNNEK